MNEVWPWLGWLAALIAGAFALRATVRFDLNEWLKSRRERKEEKVRSLCPHAYLAEEEGTIVVHSSFISPSGTLAWQCQRCGAVTHDEAATTANQRYWAKHPDELLKREKVLKNLIRG